MESKRKEEKQKIDGQNGNKKREREKTEGKKEAATDLWQASPAALCMCSFVNSL